MTPPPKAEFRRVCEAQGHLMGKWETISPRAYAAKCLRPDCLRPVALKWTGSEWRSAGPARTEVCPGPRNQLARRRRKTSAIERRP